MSHQRIHRRSSLTARTPRLKFVLCLLVIAASMPCAQPSAQTDDGSVLAPTKLGLSFVHLPDTRNMEPEVREHLTAAQNMLAAALKDKAASSDKLAEAYGMMGGIYQAYSLSSPANECYLNASRLAPKDFRWVYLLGKLHEREGDVQAAIGYYNTAHRLRSDYLPLFVSLGNIYLQLNRLDLAESFFNQALELNANSAAVQYGLGQAALSKRNYTDAAKFLEKALQLAPEANRLHYALAMAYRGLGDMGRAKSQLALSGTVGVRVSDPLLDGLQDLIKGARLPLIRGRAALEARRFVEAVEEFRKAITQQPDSVPAHFNLGAALTQTGDLRGAAEQFKETLRLDPAHTNAHYNLGLLFAQMSQHEEAITHLQAVVRATPEDYDARFLLAQELVKVNRLEEAEAEFSSIIRANVDNESALLGLVRIHLARKQYRQAISVLEKGRVQFPHQGVTAATLAYLWAASPQLELRDGARAFALSHALYEAGHTINHGVLVAMALAELGRCEEAAQWARQMSDKASAEGRPDLVEKLKADLRRYEQERPCRPISNINFNGQSPLP